MEVWVKISEGDHYMVSNYGRVKRLPYRYWSTCGKTNKPHWINLPEKILGGTKLSQKGYPRVRLGEKTYFIHYLVAKYFVPNIANKPQVNHIDGNKQNNRADNLEWVTNYENRRHAVENGLHARKVTKEIIVTIRELCRNGMPTKEIAARLNLTKTTINYYLRNEHPIT